MEGHVLSTLNWLIGHPTSESWLRVQSISDPSMISPDSKLQHVTRVLMEITLFHRAFVPLKSSEVALGCLILARYMLGHPRRIADEGHVQVQIAQMLDGHLAEHLEQVSAIVIKKCELSWMTLADTSTKFRHEKILDALACFSHASTFLREWYLAGNRFNLHAWPSSVSITPAPSSYLTLDCESRRDSSWSSVASSSTISSSPHSYRHSSSEDDEMPLTPNTPLTQYGSEDDPALLSSSHKPSPLSRRSTHQQQQRQAKEAVYHVPRASALATFKEKETTPPITVTTASTLQVNLVPTSGPPLNLC